MRAKNRKNAKSKKSRDYGSARDKKLRDAVAESSATKIARTTVCALLFGGGKKSRHFAANFRVQNSKKTA